MGMFKMGIAGEREPTEECPSILKQFFGDSSTSQLLGMWVCKPIRGISAGVHFCQIPKYAALKFVLSETDVYAL